MKKILIFVFIVFSLNHFTNAQINPHAIGLRIGGNGDINGAEISYQHKLKDVNRLELDLGHGRNDIHNRSFLVGIYQWDFVLKDAFNWYIGPAAAFGMYNFKNRSDYFNIGVGGQVGLEYDFNDHDSPTPILLSLDVRPMIDLLGNSSGFGWGAAIGVRYTWE